MHPAGDTQQPIEIRARHAGGDDRESTPRSAARAIPPSGRKYGLVSAIAEHA
jgi:hypothetical protein